ncbi:DUF4352 domain-containing protein [Streptomyces sp. CB03911]|uniref:DUF4352 domain-containing protein n=1 Tax=Streptomycetaceae TaxID=2062 RepID=UPI0009596615|nr:DUF4352 domain-containing protein [Streptomyces sp. CB03911]OKI22148.1 hypothetical protein A6A07_34275 [Streptomyces sp. CB03911]
MSFTATARRRSAALLLGAALVTLSATACTSGASVSTTPKQSAAAPAADAAKPADSGKPADQGAAKAPAAAKVGDTIALKGMEKSNTADVTAVKVVDNAESGDEYLKPADGKRWVAVQFQIKATGTKAYSDAPLGAAKVVDTQGQSYGPSFTDTTAGPSFQTPTNIAPGETGKGFITFEVPKDAKLDKIQFGLDAGFADQTGQWKIG